MASINHHYIPRFYQRRWAVPDTQMVTVFKREANGTLTVKPKSTKATGHEPHLYTKPGLPADVAQEVEDVFFREHDQDASDALDYLDQPTDATSPFWDERRRLGWARFLLGVEIRNPDALAKVKAVFARDWDKRMRAMAAEFAPDDPEYLRALDPEVVEQHALDVFKGLIKTRSLAVKLGNMPWGVRQLDRATYPLLTSDRPIVRTDGLAVDDGHLVIPISPRRVFMVAPEQRTFDRFATMTDEEMALQVNRKVVEQAVRFVYATDERQSAFIRNRMGTGKALSVVDDLRSRD